MTEYRTLSTLLGVLLLAAAVCLAIWLPFSSVDMAPSTIWSVGQLYLFAALLIALTKYVGWRLASDDGVFAGRIKYAAKSMALVCWSTIGLTCINVVMLSGAYLGAGAAFPLVDAQLAAFSPAVGFDWAAMLGWTNSHPLLMNSLYWAYTSTLVQTPILVFLLAALHQRDRLTEYVSLYILTGLVVVAFAILTPALGAYSYYQPDASLYSVLGPGPGAAHLEMTHALRSGAAMMIDFDKPVGIVTFPSFHTVLAIITTWSMRDVKIVFWPLLALNLWVIISTLPVGGHYLIDLPAGALVAFAAIWLTRRLMAKSTSEASDAPTTIVEGAVRA